MNSRMIMIIAAAMVVLAAFLPWASLLGYSKTGVDGDGAVTLVIALIGLLLVWRGWLGWVGQAIAAGLVVAIGIYDLNDVGNLAAIGLYLTFLAGVAWLVAALVWRQSTRGTVGG
jgi:hypothetical protein